MRLVIVMDPISIEESVECRLKCSSVVVSLDLLVPVVGVDLVLLESG